MKHSFLFYKKLTPTYNAICSISEILNEKSDFSEKKFIFIKLGKVVGHLK